MNSASKKPATLKMLWMLLSPIGAFLASKKADSAAGAQEWANETLKKLGRKTGRLSIRPIR